MSEMVELTKQQRAIVEATEATWLTCSILVQIWSLCGAKKT